MTRAAATTSPLLLAVSPCVLEVRSWGSGRHPGTSGNDHGDARAVTTRRSLSCMAFADTLPARLARSWGWGIVPGTSGSGSGCDSADRHCTVTTTCMSSSSGTPCVSVHRCCNWGVLTESGDGSGHNHAGRCCRGGGGMRKVMAVMTMGLLSSSSGTCAACSVRALVVRCGGAG